MRVGNQSNRLYANKNPPHIIQESMTIAYEVTYLIYSSARYWESTAFFCEIKTIAYDVIDVNVLHRKLMVSTAKGV